MRHRPLGDMLSDVYDAVQISRTESTAVRATKVQLVLPLEVRLERTDGELVFMADLPVWRWRTDFDQVPGRLAVVWEEVRAGPTGRRAYRSRNSPGRYPPNWTANRTPGRSKPRTWTCR